MQNASKVNPIQTPAHVRRNHSLEFIFLFHRRKQKRNKTAAKDGQKFITVRNYVEQRARLSTQCQQHVKQKRRKESLTGKWISPFINKQETSQRVSSFLSRCRGAHWIGIKSNDMPHNSQAWINITKSGICFHDVCLWCCPDYQYERFAIINIPRLDCSRRKKQNIISIKLTDY